MNEFGDLTLSGSVFFHGPVLLCFSVKRFHPGGVVHGAASGGGKSDFLFVPF